jgi:hypothetical protein
MAGYKWQGSGIYGGFVRQGNRNRNVPGDRERGQRLFAELASERFWCANCGGTHELRDMSGCHEMTHRDAG